MLLTCFEVDGDPLGFRGQEVQPREEDALGHRVWLWGGLTVSIQLLKHISTLSACVVGLMLVAGCGWNLLLWRSSQTLGFVLCPLVVGFALRSPLWLLGKAA